MEVALLGLTAGALNRELYPMSLEYDRYIPGGVFAILFVGYLAHETVLVLIYFFSLGGIKSSATQDPPKQL